MADPLPIPLARLLAVAARWIIDELHVRLRAAGWTNVRPAYGFVLVAVRDGPVTTTQLSELHGTTKQAVSKLVDSMVEAGYVERRRGRDGRERLVQLTTRGRQLLAEVEAIYTGIEAEWAQRAGAEDIDQLRRTLSALVVGTDGTLPPVRPLW